jgi:hydroxymethylglutaryl-CoA reductase (NADPH)
MPTDYHRANCFLKRLLRDHTTDELRERLKPKKETPARRVPRDPHITGEAVDGRWQAVAGPPESRAALLDPGTIDWMECYERNVENFIGCVKVPVGLAGPLRVNGLFAQGDYYIPLATTEAALVASYSRGAQLISEAGGCTAMLINEGMSRAPGFAFATLEEAGAFAVWALSHVEDFTREAESTTRYGRLIDLHVTLEGNHVDLSFEFTTGDASGQNMVTIATEAICAYIHSHAPVRPRCSFVEANLSGDKKASAQSFLTVRGRKVTAEVILPADLVERRLRATPKQMADYWRMSAIGGVLSGTLGVHGHYANGLAALYIACGQDAACVAESAVGITRFEVTERGELYAAVTLPNLTVGTVGGGTELPSQGACLQILGLEGPGKAAALAEVCAGLCLAGELSIIGALCAGEFAQAHRRLARGEARRSVARGVAHG